MTKLRSLTDTECINSGHLEYVFDCIDKNTTKVGNIKAYLLAALYNAPATIVMAVFDVAQHVVSQSTGVVNGNLDVTAALAGLETQLEAMGM